MRRVKGLTPVRSYESRLTFPASDIIKRYFRIGESQTSLKRRNAHSRVSCGWRCISSAMSKTNLPNLSRCRLRNGASDPPRRNNKLGKEA